MILAPMEGITDAPMRALQGATGAFSFAVSEFVRVSVAALPAKVFKREVPELLNGGLTSTGLPVQVQILGGDPERVALSALAAVRAGAKAIDLNFGCPAKTVNRNDGGASLLKHPGRIREIVAATRAALPSAAPLSAKLRLGWSSTEDVHVNAAMAAEGGASWLTIHARTRTQGYEPPVYWKPVAEVREALGIPVVANGDIWTLDDFRRCQDETGCRHFMIGRGAMADPLLPLQIATELGLRSGPVETRVDWPALLAEFERRMVEGGLANPSLILTRMKQWLKLAHLHGGFKGFDRVKAVASTEDLMAALEV